MPILMKRLDGTQTPYKNSEYIPAYLFLPAAILDRCPQELQLPRTVRSYFHDRNVISTVESDLFIELMMDAYAYLVWPYLGVPGYMENYSGYDPVYIIAHSPAFWVQTLQDESVISKVEDLMRSGQSEIMRRPSEAEVSFYLEQIIPIAMERYGLQDGERLRLGEYYQDKGFVFAQDNGQPIHTDGVTDWMKKFSKRHNLPHINPHAFRHTMASMLYFNGIDSVSISKRLGHAQVSTTANIYAHVMECNGKSRPEKC